MRTTILSLTDWHLGLQFRGDPFVPLRFHAGIEKRLSDAIGRALAYCQADEVVLWFGGDLIHGLLHPHTDRLRLKLALPEQLLRATRLANAIIDQADKLDLPVKAIVVTPGNHARINEKAEAGAAAPSFEDAIAADDPRRVFHPVRAVVRVGKLRLGFQHGHHLRTTSVASAAQKVLRCRQAQPTHWDFVGHYHRFCVDSQVVFCPAACPFDATGMALGGVPDSPAVLATTFEDSAVSFQLFHL